MAVKTSKYLYLHSVELQNLQESEENLIESECHLHICGFTQQHSLVLTPYSCVVAVNPPYAALYGPLRGEA